MRSTIAYRADIDGLRALAVLAVILFHLDQNWLPGGYVGVDIFFVISGYLISRILQREIKEGSFSFTEFYARRMRRIVPALALVILTSAAVFHLIFSPGDFVTLVESALYSQVFLSNVYFAFVADASYFSDEVHSQVFLHLWSLAVEEQFYLCWPLLMLIGLRAQNPKLLLIGLPVLCLLSFLSGDAIHRIDPMTAYYMLPSRLGEFGLGALVALLQERESLARFLLAPRFAATSMLLGFSMIAWSLAALTPESIFPGMNALLPTAGAALVVLGGIPNPWPARLLGHALPVFIGRISYSAYLWHWPIVAGIRYVEGDLDLVQKAIAFVATFLLAFLTYHLIEQPFRRRPLGLVPVTLHYTIVPGAILLLAATGLKATDGQGLFAFSPEFRKQYQHYLSGLHPNYQADYVCQQKALARGDVVNRKCITGAALKREPDILLWGDSKAAHLAGLLGKVGEHTGDSIRNVAHSACAPVKNDPARFSPKPYVESCALSAEVVWPAVLGYRKVILAADWGGYLKRDANAFEATLIETITTLKDQGIKPALVGELPFFPKYDRECYLIKMKVAATDCEERARAPRSLITPINDRIRHVAEATGTPYFDFTDLLCNKTTCYAQIDDAPIYYDPGHLSIDGSIRVGELALEDRALLSKLRAFFD